MELHKNKSGEDTSRQIVLHKLLPLKTLFNFLFLSYSFLVGPSGTHASQLNLLRASKINNEEFDFHFVCAWLWFDVPMVSPGPATQMEDLIFGIST